MSFQSTLPRGERLVSAISSSTSYDFNPRSREGSDQIPFAYAVRCCLFQSTLPRGERPFCAFFFFFHVDISIHAPARGATRLPRLRSSCLTDFNPRSREGSDRGTQPQYILNAISIHAPARGATIKQKERRWEMWISIHAPARGATSHRPLSCPQI